MNKDNVVLVRAMNNLPLNGELVPSCEGERLVYDEQSEFYYYIRKKVIQDLENRLGRPLDVFLNPDDKKLQEDTIAKYKILKGPYYTTTLSFSLNGMVPDDINNNFTDMNIAVIDPIKHYLNANFVTIDAIDTTIKGRVSVSKDAILLINNDVYNTLTDDVKANLMNSFKVKVFQGKLRQSVDNTLKENGYPSLPLIQKREMDNIDEYVERESMISFEDKFAESIGASRLSLQNLTFSYSVSSADEVDKIAHEKIKEEHNNNLIVVEYYRDQLYNFLLNKAEIFGIEVRDEEKYYLFTDYMEGEEAMKRIVSDLIDAYGGIDKFHGFIQEYNEYIIKNYITNKEIVDLSESNKKTY